MIKFTQGDIGSKDGRWVDIVVKASAPNGLKDMLIGGSIVAIGITYLTYTAFRNGSKAFERAELYALREAGCIDWDPEDVL